MNIEDKLAKPDKTIGQHSNELIEQAKLLYKLGYIKSDNLYSDLLVSCLKHDNGKANSQFQKRITKGGNFQPEQEIPHSILSTFFIDKSECIKPISVYFAVLYHHYNKDSPVTVFKENREYAMSVIVARALPDVRDGLKPVQRRILYGMNELGVTPDKPYKKSARIVGDVMGKYHPHGDSSIYEGLVRMAQDFSYRYMLVDGHGNFGSVDGDGAAAMRYTEARMSKIAVEMLRDINKDTIDFQDNYDGTEKEPVVLPARFPNLLVNGATGIAVGMTTNIPPHNLSETISALHVLMDHPDATTADLMQALPGPDFPTGGVVMGKSGIRHAYETGRGTIVLRGKVDVQTEKSGRERIVITEIPYMVNKAKMVERIADLVHEKKIDGIVTLRDESDRDGMRIVIDVRRDASASVILNNLYKLTPLQTGFSFNMVAIVNGAPKVLSLKQILQYYLDHQENVIRRRTQYDLKKAKAREHILEGLRIALDHIDEIITIIRSSESSTYQQHGLPDAFLPARYLPGSLRYELYADRTYTVGFVRYHHRYFEVVHRSAGVCGSIVLSFLRHCR